MPQFSSDEEVPSGASIETINPAVMETAPPILEDEADASQYDGKLSFLADSPYYSSFVESELNSLDTLTGTLHDISSRTKTFSKCGTLMAEATRRLAMSCRLRREDDIHDGETEDINSARRKIEQLVNQRRKALGEEMSDFLSLLGEVLDEIASAQFDMCNILETTLGMSLEAFAGSESQTVSLLKQEADQTTDAAEQIFFKYITGKPSGFGLSAGDGTYDHKKHRGKFGKRNVPRSSTFNMDDAALSRAMSSANVRLNLEQIRLGQATAELRRFQLLKHLADIKHRRNFELGESALASLNGMRAYFHHCGDLVTGLVPRMDRIQKKQNELRQQHETQEMPIWAKRENKLIDTLKGLHEATADAHMVTDAVANGSPTLIEQQLYSLEEIENAVEFWKVPAMLANSSRYNRIPLQDVVVEGWLYKKSAARMSLNPWHRRWFIMTKDSIYYYRSSAETRKANGGVGCSYTSERVKICDVVLCTVRELPSNENSTRFCFEICTPKEKPLTVQARGPEEYKMWVDGIRSNLADQLVHGDPHSNELNKNIGKKNTHNNHHKTGSGDNDGATGQSLSADGNSAHTSGENFDASADSAGNLTRGAAFAHTPKNPIVKEILEANPTCADCSCSAPDWVSLNLGILICMECSGVHRSLGVHVSKVRSLKLDSLSDGEGRLLLSLGNETMNSIWENGINMQKGWTKPNEKADRKAREEWIKSKYIWKGFLAYSASDGKTEEERNIKFSHDLYDAVKRGNVGDAARALALGASVDWKNKDDNGRTPLHACVCARKPENNDNPKDGHMIECAELLLQNGAKMDALDHTDTGVLDSALLSNADREMIEYLTSKLN